MCFFVVPIGSMYGIHPYIWLIFMVNVGKYTIHGSYGFEAIDDETFTPSSIRLLTLTPRILRSFNTEWTNTSCTSAKACRNGEVLLQFFQLEYRSFSIPFCKISRRSVKTFVEGGPNIYTQHPYSQIS